MVRILALVLVGVVLGCGDPAPLRIAVVEGNGAHYAAELAAEDINAAGGINGRLLELRIVLEPDGVTPAQAIAIADTLTRDPSILAVVGHGGSATSLAASQVYNTHGLPQIAPTTTSPLYTNAGPNSFRLVASDEHQGEFIARFIAAEQPGASIALLYVNDDYGVALHGFVVEALRRRGIAPRYEAPFIRGAAFERSVDELTRSLRSVGPDLIVWVGLAPELQILRPRLRDAVPRARVLGSDGVSFIATVADSLLFVGDRVVALVDVHAQRPPLRDVAARFEPLSGRALTDAAALTYDAVGLIARALRAGATSRAAVRRYLNAEASAGNAYQGITGAIVLDENGDARPSYVLLEIAPGGARVVAR